MEISAVFGAEHINFDSCIFILYRLLSLFGLTGMTLEIIFQILVRFRYPSLGSSPLPSGGRLEFLGFLFSFSNLLPENKIRFEYPRKIFKKVHLKMNHLTVTVGNSKWSRFFQSEMWSPKSAWNKTHLKIFQRYFCPSIVCYLITTIPMIQMLMIHS